MPLMRAMTWSPLGMVERPTSVRPLSKVLCSPCVPDLPFMFVGRVSQDQLPLLLLGPAMGVRTAVTTWALLPGPVHQCPLVWALVTLVLLALTCPEPHGNRHQVLLWAPHLDLAHWAVPVANTTPGFPFMSPPPPSFSFNPEIAGATAGQAPSSVARSTNPARATVTSDVNVSPYPQVDSRSRSTSFQRVAHRDHRRGRSRLPAAYSRPCVPGASGPSSPEPRPAVPNTGRRVAHQQPPAVALPARRRSWQQHPPGAAPQTTNSSVGHQAAARPTSWAIDPNDIPQRSITSTFPEPSEEQGRLCPIAGCNNTSRLVRHATVQHLPWFSNPVMACWICGVQYVKGTKLKDHWRRHHRDVDISTNWGEYRFDDYFRRVESFVTSASALRRGEASLSEIFQEIFMLDDFAVLNAGVVCPDLGLFESFLTRHGETPVSQYRISRRPDWLACLLHWRVLLQLPVPLTPEQRQRVLDEHGGTPEQSEGRRLLPMQVNQPEEVLGATALPEWTT